MSNELLRHPMNDMENGKVIASNLPLVSIVVPSYNYGHFLPDALESILAQTLQDWECIVVDDGSVDSTRKIVSTFMELDIRIKYIYQSNLGLSAARNTGIAASKGQYIQLLDADDKLENRKLELHVDLLERHQNIDIVYGDVRYFQGNGVTLNVDIAKRMSLPCLSGAGHDVLIELIRRNVIGQPGTPLARKGMFNDVGEFNRGLAAHEDWEYWIRCAIKGKYFQYAKIENTCVLIRAHANSMTQNILSMLTTNLTVRQWLQARPLPADLRRLNNYRIGLQLAKLAKFKMSKKEYALGFNHAAQALWQLRFDARIIAVSIFLLTPESLATRLVLAMDHLRNFLLPGKRH